MRKDFQKLLHLKMHQYKNIYFLTADLGYGVLENIQEDFCDRFFNVAAAEQNMLGIATGLAQNDKIPIFYSITPFFI